MQPIVDTCLGQSENEDDTLPNTEQDQGEDQDATLVTTQGEEMSILGDEAFTSDDIEEEDSCDYSDLQYIEVEDYEELPSFPKAIPEEPDFSTMNSSKLVAAFIERKIREQYSTKIQVSPSLFQPLYQGSNKKLIHWIFEFATNKFRGRSWAMLEEDLIRDLSNFPSSNSLPRSLRELRQMLSEVCLVQPLHFLACDKGLLHVYFTYF